MTVTGATAGAADDTVAAAAAAVAWGIGTAAAAWRRR
jgi:hypothetical protein